jgi:hypothetical protein
METPETVTEETAVTYVKAASNYKHDDGTEERIEAGVSFDPGSDLTDAVEKYGEEVVFQRYFRGVTKDLGNAIRSGINKYFKDDKVDISEIAAKVSAELENWRPDVSRRPARKEASKSILDNFDTLSPEKQAEVIAALQAKAAAA